MPDSRITAFGSSREEPARGLFGYGVPVAGAARRDGGLSVTGGAERPLAATDGGGVALSVGRGAGYSGTVVLTDPGSRLALAGSTAALAIGAEGAEGTTLVLPGAALALEATAAATLEAGQDAGAHGMLDVLGGTLALEAAATTLRLGSDGGTGRMRLLDAAQLEMAAGSAGAALEIGTIAGDGRLLIAEAAARVTAAGGPVRLVLGGDGGQARLDIDGPPAAPDGSLPAAGLRLQGASAEAGIGLRSTGGLAMDGGHWAVTATTGTAEVTLGAAGGTGRIEAAGGARLDIAGQTAAELRMAEAGEATLALSGATLAIDAARGAARLLAGRDGGTARLVLDDGAALTLTAAGDALLALGRGGSGVLEVSDGATARIAAGGDARLVLGPDATAHLAAGGALDLAAAGRALLHLEGGARLDLDAGAGLTLAGHGAAPAPGGAALALGPGATLRLDSGAALHSEGAVALGAGATATLSGATLSTPALQLAEGATLAGTGLLQGADGRLEILGGSLQIGDRPGAEGGLIPATGTLRLDGTLTLAAGRIVFDLMPSGADLLTLAGQLALTGGSLTLRPDAAAPPAPEGVLLARADGGIRLDEVTPPPGHRLELRAGDTELWSLPPAPGTLAPLSGQLLTRGGAPLAEVEVAFTGVAGSTAGLTDAAGRFALEVPADAPGQLSATAAALPPPPRPATADALEALRLAVGLAPSWGPAAATDFIAADITGDGRVSTEDALVLLRLAVGLEAAQGPRWLFLDAAADLSAVTREAAASPPSPWLLPDPERPADLLALAIGLLGEPP